MRWRSCPINPLKIDKRLLDQARFIRWSFVAVILLGLGGGVLVILQARLLSKVVSLAFLGGSPVSNLRDLFALLLGVFALRAALAWALESVSTRGAVRVKARLRQELIDHLLALGPAFVGQERTGELVQVVSEGVEALEAYFSQYLPQLALAALVPLAYLLVVLPLDPLSGVVLLLTAPLIPLFMTLIGGLSQGHTRRQWHTLSRLSAHFLDILQGLPTLKLLGRSRDQADLLAQAGERYRLITMGVLRITFLSALALELVATLSTAVVAVEIGLRLLAGRLAFEQALFVLLLTPEFYLPLRLLGARFHAAMAGEAAARRIFQLQDVRPRVPLPKPGLPFHFRHSPDVNSDIRFEDVHYAYDGARSALNGVSLEIRAGQTVALVGPSGSGKSTLVSLLLRFIEPDSGRIWAGGECLQNLNLHAWRAQVAWVPQQPTLFHGTVLENIRLARPEATLEQVVQAAQRAQADGFIRDLPLGYDTQIGERGARMSGGQARRIALARAFLKDAPLLILDEATANLDPRSEAEVQCAIQDLLSGRKALLVAHRLHTVQKADQIVVLDGGRIVQQGSFPELLSQPGLFSRMADALRDGLPPDGDETGQLTKRSMPDFDRRASPLGSGVVRNDHPFDTPFAERSLGEVEFAIRPTNLAPIQFSGIADDSGLRENRYEKRLKNLPRLLGLARPFAGWVGLSALAGFATIASGIGLLAASAFIISKASLASSIVALQVAIVGVRAFGLSRGVFRYLERVLTHQTSLRLATHLRTWFYHSLESLAPARLIDYRGGDLLNRAVADVAYLEGFYARSLAPPLVALLVSGLVLAALSRIEAALAWAALVPMILAGLALPWLVGCLSRKPAEKLGEARARLQITLVDGLQGMADLIANGQGSRLSVQIARHSATLGRLQSRLGNIAGLQAALIGLLTNLGLQMTLTCAVFLSENQRFEAVYLASLALGVLAAFEALAPLSQASQVLSGSLAAAGRLFEILDAKPEARLPHRPCRAPHAFELLVRDLRFRYPVGTRREPGELNAGRYALDGISFDLPPGKRLGITGLSGAGKTTLVNLLLRFWEYDEGSIIIDGYDLRCYRPEDLYQVMTVVTQVTHLFNATLRENLLLGRPNASQAQVEQAVRLAQLSDFIRSLPEGYETHIGEGGLRLSAGERQRLAIARAFLQETPLLVLDEPTANLDPLTEHHLLCAVEGVTRNRSLLLITHRLVGLEAMDEILVLDNGRVVERGHHAELLAIGGLYRQMWDIQRQSLLE